MTNITTEIYTQAIRSFLLIDMGSEIECPSCNSRNSVPIRNDQNLRSFIVLFDSPASRKCMQCQDCGNRFQVITMAR